MALACFYAPSAVVHNFLILVGVENYLARQTKVGDLERSVICGLPGFFPAVSGCRLQPAFHYLHLLFTLSGFYGDVCAEIQLFLGLVELFDHLPIDSHFNNGIFLGIGIDSPGHIMDRYCQSCP
jgi:hypothetical protein